MSDLIAVLVFGVENYIKGVGKPTQVSAWESVLTWNLASDDEMARERHGVAFDWRDSSLCCVTSKSQLTCSFANAKRLSPWHGRATRARMQYLHATRSRFTSFWWDAFRLRLTGLSLQDVSVTHCRCDVVARGDLKATRSRGAGRKRTLLSESIATTLPPLRARGTDRQRNLPVLV